MVGTGEDLGRPARAWALALAGRPGAPLGGRRWWMPYLIALALLPAVLVVVPVADDSGVVYPVACALYVAMTAVCVQSMRREGARDHARPWMWMGVHSAALVAVYAMAAASSWQAPLPGRGVAWAETAAQMVAFGACLEAFLCTLVERDRAQRVLDGVLLLLLCGLLFLTVSSMGPLGTRPCRLWVAPLREVFLWVCSLLYARAWTGRAHRRLARMISGYLLLTLAATLASNIVPLWLPTTARENAALDMLFALPMLWFVNRATEAVPRPDAEVVGGTAARSGLWLSMLPSFLFLGCVGLVLVNAGRFHRGSVLLTAAVVVVFAVRTQVLSRRLEAEKAALLEASRAMEELATVDPLTGVRNRRWLETEGARVLRVGAEVRAALLLIDTDRFKEVNDTFGHAAGDALLLALSGAIRRVTREHVRAGCVRLGGDEFVVLLPGADLVLAGRVAEQLRQEVEHLPLPDGRRCVSVSVGVAATTGPVRLGALLELADEALYRAKARGRNRVELAQEDAVLFARNARHTDERRFRPETDAAPVAAERVSP